MTIKGRLIKLEKAASTRAPEMNWKRFIQCDSLDELPADLRRKWAETMEHRQRSMSSLAGALESISGQSCTADEAAGYLARITNKSEEV